MPKRFDPQVGLLQVRMAMDVATHIDCVCISVGTGGSLGAWMWEVRNKGKIVKSRSLDDVAKGIRDWGYKELVFSLTSTGTWTAKDAEWNYLDVPHLNEVHSQATAETLFYADRASSSILEQRVGPLKFGALVTIYGAKEGSLAYASSLGPVIILVESTWRNTGHVEARVDTTYHLFAPRLLAFCLPLVRKVLARNYNILMSEDLPLRNRKGALRLRGYRFSHDGLPHSFLDSRQVRKNNVIPPELPVAEWTISKETLLNQGEVLLGSDDASGIRLVVDGTDFVLLPRMCMHEGACLDGQRMKNGALRCPWHGRTEKAIARVSLSQLNGGVEQYGRYSVTVTELDVLITTSGAIT